MGEEKSDSNTIQAYVMDSAKPYRFLLYEKFAALAKEKKVRWVVLHGTEGYPNSIGRDLDCLCETSNDADIAFQCFEEAAKVIGATKWILYPHPIWGRRCVAVSADFESAELHILHGLRSGPVSCRVNYEQVDFSVLFPHDRQAWYIKSIVLPLLGNSSKVKKAIQSYGLHKLPLPLQKAYASLEQNGRIRIRERLSIYWSHCEGLGSACSAVVYALKNKVRRYFAQTVPVYYLPPELSNEELQEVEAALQDVFLRSVDCTGLSVLSVWRLRSQQFFLYVRVKRRSVSSVDVGQRKEKVLCDYIMEVFNKVAQYH